ncbi:MAG: ATP-binding protein [Bacteroidales bacterium]|nr:ATP-binding protein [Bacteroidales bacterium]
MEINRTIIGKLATWKDAEVHKPVLLVGARQTGKTWVMQEFGKRCFEHVAFFDFSETLELGAIFERTKEPERLLKELSLQTGVPIIPGKTLVIFDEIQECEAAFNSLKYFCDRAPQYHIIAAGSLLGVTVRRRKMTVPVGKVTMMRMHPISFSEFLCSSDPVLFDFVSNLEKAEHLPEIIHGKLNMEYRRYLVSGGMPEAVVAMLDNKGMSAVEAVLQDILDLYELDFAKYAEPREVPRISALWHSLPSQLSKENRKFVYSVVQRGARAKDYEDGLLWLEEAGMIHRVFSVSKPAMPLAGYREVNAFKAYACDCGILRRLARVPSDVVLGGSSNYTEFKGSMAENMILQSYVAATDEIPYYWNSEGRAEVEFVVQHGVDIVPVEVKAAGCVGGKSLTLYNEKFQPPVRVRFSSNNLQANGNLISCPSYLSDWLFSRTGWSRMLPNKENAIMP